MPPPVSAVGNRADDIAIGVQRPTRGRAGHSWSLYSALLQAGFGRRCVAATTGRSCRPISTLPPNQAGGGMFLCHFPSPATARKPPPKPGRYPAPCPVEPGLSSPAGIAPHRGGHPVSPASPASNLAQGHCRVKLGMIPQQVQGERKAHRQREPRIGIPLMTATGGPCARPGELQGPEV